jgi:hypothetical protein
MDTRILILFMAFQGDFLQFFEVLIRASAEKYACQTS